MNVHSLGIHLGPCFEVEPLNDGRLGRKLVTDSDGQLTVPSKLERLSRPVTVL
jgi:hypothetical protein